MSEPSEEKKEDTEEKKTEGEAEKADVKAESVSEEKTEKEKKEPAKKAEKAEKKAEEKAPEKTAEKPKEKPAKKAQDGGNGKMSKEEIIATIENMSVLELSEMIKEMQEKFGVTAAAPVAAVAAAASEGEAAAEEQTEFDVVLSAVGDKKIQVIKEVRVITGLSLKEAKDLVDGAPKPVKEKISKEEAEKIKGQLEGAGATAELK